MRIVIPVVLVLVAVYGLTVALKPHLAVPRNKVLSPTSILIARLKGIIAFGLAAFLLYQQLG